MCPRQDPLLLLYIAVGPWILHDFRIDREVGGAIKKNGKKKSKRVCAY